MSRAADHRRGLMTGTRRGLTIGTAAVLAVCLSAGTALADSNPLGPSEGADPGKGLGAAATIGLFVLVPLVALVLIGSVVWLPDALKAGRYRPGRRWAAAPVWFAGPPEPAAAVQDAHVGDVPRGGASGSW